MWTSLLVQEGEVDPIQISLLVPSLRNDFVARWWTKWNFMTELLPIFSLPWIWLSNHQGVRYNHISTTHPSDRCHDSSLIRLLALRDLIKYKLCSNTVSCCNRRLPSKYHRCECRCGLQMKRMASRFPNLRGSAYSKWPHHAIYIGWKRYTYIVPGFSGNPPFADAIASGSKRGHPVEAKLLISASH